MLIQTGVPSNRLALYFQGKPLQDKDRLNQSGVAEGELLYLTILPQQQQQVPRQQQPGQSFNIADMIKNFDKARKQSGDGFVEKRVEDFMSSAEKAYLETKDDHYRLSELSEVQP